MNTFPVAEIDGVTAAFGATDTKALLPPYADIPREFKSSQGNVWNKLVADWFFFGLKNLQLTPKDGIDKDKALRHIKAVISSFEPKHEHKEAGCAYLLSLWFTDPKWERAK